MNLISMEFCMSVFCLWGQFSFKQASISQRYFQAGKRVRIAHQNKSLVGLSPSF